MAHPRVGQVQSTDAQNGFAGSGFVVYDGAGKTVASFGFLKEAEANIAAKKMSEIIAACAEVTKL